MILNEQWLRDWVSLDLSATEIADVLTNAGLEVDGVEKVGDLIPNLVVGRVLEVSKHPDADRLNLTKIDIGDEVLEIVCGAPNVRPEMLVAVAKIGAKLPNGLKIKRAKVRGVESHGMLCSAQELGLVEQSSGLLELGEDACLGQRVDEYLQLDEHIIDIDLTPNRGDCLSIAGVAREVNVLTDATLHPLDVSPIPASTDRSITVDVREPALCPHYSARVITDIQSAVTPLWMAERLRRCGIRPISAVVDITNYVMLELGQPMHAFDLVKLGNGVVVRLAEQGEKITLLDESVAELNVDTLVIADQEKPLAIAGVMGGLDSAIDGDKTTDIVLESAHFAPSCVAGRARQYGLHTESSHRFERGVDAALPEVAIERATELIMEICGGNAGPVKTASSEKHLPVKPAVELGLTRLQSLLGMPLERNEITQILKRISDQVDIEGEQWSVVPPSYRFDIALEADLIEEVARVKGYDAIPTIMPHVLPASQVAGESIVSPRRMRELLVARDYREAITYSFISLQMQARFDDELPVKLQNPLAENMGVMRTSLLPGLMAALQFNSNRQHNRVRLFEIGATYHLQEGGFVEVSRLSGVIQGTRAPAQWGMEGNSAVDFYDLKGDIEALLSLTDPKNPIIFNEFEHISAHPGQVCSLVRETVNGPITLGWMGRLHPKLEQEYDVKQVFMFELELDALCQTTLPSFVNVSKFPSVRRDLSVSMGETIPIATLFSVVRGEAGSALSGLELFDVYRGAGVAKGEKSVSFSMTLQHADATMTDEQAESIVEAVLTALQRDLKAVLRS